MPYRRIPSQKSPACVYGMYVCMCVCVYVCTLHVCVYVCVRMYVSEKAWNDFYATSSGWLDKYYPITITSREPPFMTPDTKFLLRKKNRL